MKMDFEQKLHSLQMEADGIAAIASAIDNTVADFDENETITAMMALAKMTKAHADNIQAAIALLDKGDQP